MSRTQTVYTMTLSLALLLGPACSSSGEAGRAEMEGGGSMGGAADGVEIAPLPTCPESSQGFATSVIDYEFGPGQDFGQDEFPEIVLGGPRGGGLNQGSLHVASLGDGGSVTLGFGPRSIVDGDGIDFIVFENPFLIGGDTEQPLAELGVVAVSTDGKEWKEFPCVGGDKPPFDQCAGWRPAVGSVIVGKGADPFDAEEAGGDGYDLADVGLSEAKFVRVRDFAGDDAVFDLDAVAIVNGKCQ